MIEITLYPLTNYCAACGKLGPHQINIGDRRFWLCQWCAVELETKLGDAVAARLHDMVNA